MSRLIAFSLALLIGCGSPAGGAGRSARIEPGVDPGVQPVAERSDAPPGSPGQEPVELFAFERSRPAMGTLFVVRCFAPDSGLAEAAMDAAFARLEELQERLSDYESTSEVSLLTRAAAAGPTGEVPASDDLLRVLAIAEEVSSATDGAFDVTVGSAVRLWRRARRQAVLPDEERLALARRTIGFDGVELDPRTRTVQLGRGGIELDLGGIAKGFALDEMLAALARSGIDRALVDGGGDLAASGPPPGEEGWLVAVERESPGEGEGAERPYFRLAHGALATSGDSARFALIEGVRYSHIVDPRTAMALTRGRGASVLAPSGALADAWASALCVLGPEDGLATLRAAAAPDLAAQIVERDGATLISRESIGWSLRLLTASPPDPRSPR